MWSQYSNLFGFRILQCGLRGFVGNANSTLDSEVGILGYLSFAYESDLKFALKEMLQVSLNSMLSSQLMGFFWRIEWID